MGSAKRVTEMGERYKVYYITKGVNRGSCKHQHRTIYDAYHCLRHDINVSRKSGGCSDRFICAVEDGLERELNEQEINQLDHIRRLMLKETLR